MEYGRGATRQAAHIAVVAESEHIERRVANKPLRSRATTLIATIDDARRLRRSSAQNAVCREDRVTQIMALPVPQDHLLREIFDLTSAEVRLAQRMAQGESLAEIAHALDIKMSTARTQLASLFAKTNTKRQAKLVAILSRIAHIG